MYLISTLGCVCVCLCVCVCVCVYPCGWCECVSFRRQKKSASMGAGVHLILSLIWAEFLETKSGTPNFHLSQSSKWTKSIMKIQMGNDTCLKCIYSTITEAGLQITQFCQNKLFPKEALISTSIILVTSKDNHLPFMQGTSAFPLQ